MSEMSTFEIRHRFLRTFNGKRNMFTTDVIDYGQSGSLIYELSNNHYFDLYGVTVLTMDGKHLKDMCRSFPSAATARAYIDSDEFKAGEVLEALQ